MQGGDWEMVRSAVGSAGETSLSGGNDRVVQSIGEPFATRTPMGGAQDLFASGYLSSVLFEFAYPRVKSITAQGAISQQGMTFGVGGAIPVKLQFSADMASLSLPSAVTITAIRDHMSSPVSFSWTTSIIYSSGTQSAEVYPAGTWPKGHLYKVLVSTDAIDVNGSPLTETATYFFSTIRDYAVDNRAAVMEELESQAFVPAGAFAEDYFLILSTDSNTQPI